MLRKKLIAVAVMVVFIAVTFFAVNTQGAIDEQENNPNTVRTPSAGFIKFEGMDGESKDDNHDGWCDLVGFEVGLLTPEEADGKKTGRRIHDTVKVTKFIDKTTPLILRALCKEEKIENMIIESTATWGGSTEEVYYKYELKDVRVTDHVTTCEDTESLVPMETISLSYKEMTVTYYETDETGIIMGTTQYTVDDEDGKKKK